MPKYKISMVEGDFGVDYTINIINGTVSSEDHFLIQIKKDDGTALITKNITGVTDHITFSLTQSESSQLSAKDYYYTVDWYRNEIFLKNIINKGLFRVEDKV